MRQALEAARPLRRRKRGPFLGHTEIGDCSLGRHRLLWTVERVHAHRPRPHRHPLHAGGASGEHVEFEPFEGESLAGAGDAAQRLYEQPAHRSCAPPAPPPPPPASVTPSFSANSAAGVLPSTSTT